jgi:hypothetical protein
MYPRMSCNVPSVSFPELSADPVNPSRGRLKLYAKADGLYTKDDAGVVTPVASGAAVDSISTLSPIAADQFLYTNGVNQFNTSPITLLARQLLDDTDQATMLTTLGAQPLSADLTLFVTNASWVGSTCIFAGGLSTNGSLLVNGSVQVDNSVNVDGNCSLNADVTIGTLLGLPLYQVGTVPAAGGNTGAFIFVTDETGGSIPAFSDGVNWRRVTDRAIIS